MYMNMKLGGGLAQRGAKENQMSEYQLDLPLAAEDHEL